MINDELLQQFGESIGIRNLSLDIQRSCQLNIDNNFLILVNEIDNENLLLNGIIGSIPQTEVERSAVTLLSMNMLFANIDGPYISWEPKNNFLLISKPVATAETDALAFQEQISHLLQNIHHIKDTLREAGIDITFNES